MKRLPAGTWTTEDTDIWVRVLERHGLYWYASNLIWFQEQDRRDAELMLRAQTPQFREFPWLWGSDKMWNIDVRGPVQWYNLFDET